MRFIPILILIPLLTACAGSQIHESDRVLLAQSRDAAKQVDEALPADAWQGVKAIVADILRNLDVMIKIHGDPENPNLKTYTQERSEQGRKDAEKDHPFSFGILAAIAGILFGATQFLKNTLPKLMPFLKTFLDGIAPGIAPILGLLAPALFDATSGGGFAIGGALSAIVGILNRTETAPAIGKGVRWIMEKVKLGKIAPLFLDSPKPPQQ